jgi:transcriptional regulator with XRE-family HTH domain
MVQIRLGRSTVNILETVDYKTIIQERVKELRASPQRLTLQQLAAAVPMQYTYLSKVLHSDKAHLSEDHLYAICEALAFDADSTEYLLMLRSLSLTTHKKRRQYLSSRIDKFRQMHAMKASWSEFDSRRFDEEAGYLLDPLCVVVHVALHIEACRRHPDALRQRLGVPAPQFAAVLQKLAAYKLVELGKNGQILKASTQRLHFGKEHPLMTAHQHLLRALCGSYLPRVPAEKKESFLLTFSADEAGFEQIQTAFRAFLRKAEGIIERAGEQHAYQLGFDLFQWT